MQDAEQIEAATGVPAEVLGRIIQEALIDLREQEATARYDWWESL